MAKKQQTIYNPLRFFRGALALTGTTDSVSNSEKYIIGHNVSCETVFDRIKSMVDRNPHLFSTPEINFDGGKNIKVQLKEEFVVFPHSPRTLELSCGELVLYKKG